MLKNDQLAQAFIEHFPPRSANPAFRRLAGTPSGTDNHHDGSNLAARVDAQVERIAQLEVEVDMLVAGIEQVLAANRVTGRHDGKKHPKKRTT